MEGRAFRLAVPPALWPISGTPLSYPKGPVLPVDFSTYLPTGSEVIASSLPLYLRLLTFAV